MSLRYAPALVTTTPRSQETGMSDIFGPWREEFPPADSIPHEWLEDVKNKPEP